MVASHLCPSCGARSRNPLAKHIKREYGEDALKKALVDDKQLSQPACLDASFGRWS